VIGTAIVNRTCIERCVCQEGLQRVQNAGTHTVKLITENSGEDKTLLDTSDEGRKWFGPLLVVGSIILWMALLQWFNGMCVRVCV